MAVAWAAGLACLLALMHRMRLGADVTDESFALALPYRFVLGDRPFVDEISIQQTAGLVFYPFVWLFVKVTGGTTGLVLFARAVHLFVVKGITAAAVYACSRRWLRERAAAIAVSFLAFAFVPHSIPNVGYNLLGTALLAAGSFFCGAGLFEESEKKREHFFFFAGVCEGLMAFAYPPLVVAPLLTGVLVLVLVPKKRFHAFLALVAGGAVAIAMILPALRYGGIAGVKRSISWGIHAQQTHTWPRFETELRGIGAAMPAFFPYAVLGLVVAAVTRSRSVVAIVVVGCVLGIVLWGHGDPQNTWTTMTNVAVAGFLGPLMILATRPDGKLWRGVTLISLPALAAALAAGFTSTQGITATGIGCFTTMLLFALLAARALERAGADGVFCLLPAVVLNVFLVLCFYDFVYRDGPVAQLTETVKTGPFKGIRTTESRAHAFAEMSAIAKTHDHAGGRITFLYEASGYYLFSKMPPGAHTVWEEHYGDQPGMLAYWQATRGAGIVVRVKGSATGTIDKALTPPERKIEETTHFIVYSDH